MYSKKATLTILNAAHFLAKIEQIAYNVREVRPMSEYLSSEKLPQFLFSHDRSFQPGEKHVTRVCPEDVLLLMFSGVLRFTEDGVPVEVRGGEYYIQKRGLSQQGQVPSDRPVYYYVHFLGHWSSEGGIRKRGPLPAEAQALTRRLAEADQLGAPLLERTSLFYQLLTLLCHSRPQTPAERLAESALQQLQHHLKDGAPLARIAAELHVSESYLIRIFRRRYQTTPHRCLTLLRLEQAQRLMRYSDLSLEAISLECGFRSYANFYKAFCAEKGENPAAVLKRLR